MRSWCDRVRGVQAREFQLFRFFMFYVTQITRLSLVSFTHAARKSLENQRLNAYLSVTKTRPNTGTEYKTRRRPLTILFDLNFKLFLRERWKWTVRRRRTRCRRGETFQYDKKRWRLKDYFEWTYCRSLWSQGTKERPSVNRDGHDNNNNNNNNNNVGIFEQRSIWNIRIQV